MLNAATSGDLLDLTFAISRGEGTGYVVRLHARLGDAYWQRGPYRLYLDEARFPLTLPPDDYGERLGEALFEAPRLLVEFELARRHAHEQRTLVRWRILFDTSLNDAEQLNAMRWETIRHPRSGEPLLLCPDLIFSRFVMLRRPFTPGPLPQGCWRALAAAPSPADSAAWGLPRLDPPAEFEPLALAESAGSLEPRAFPRLEGEACTVEGLLDGLRGRDYGHTFELLYLACQGAAAGFEQPVIFFERPDGLLRVVRCDDFNTWLGALGHALPRLVVLTAAERSAPAAPPALVRLGQILPRAGIPAGVGVQGCLSDATANRFFPTFFAALDRREPVDCAIYEARQAVSTAADWWMPVLFMALEDGYLALPNGRAWREPRPPRPQPPAGGPPSPPGGSPPPNNPPPGGETFGIHHVGEWDWPGGDDDQPRHVRVGLGRNPPAPHQPSPFWREPNPSAGPARPLTWYDLPPLDPPSTGSPRPPAGGAAPGRSPGQPPSAPSGSNLPRRAKLAAESDALIAQGKAHLEQKLFSQAIHCFERVLAIQLRLGDPVGAQMARKEMALARTGLGQELLNQRQYVPALDQLRHAAELASALQNDRLLGYILHARGLAHLHLGDDLNAIQALELARPLRKASRDPAGYASTCWELALIYQRLNDLPLAAERLAAVVEHDRATHSPELPQHLAMLERVYQRLRAG